MANGKVDTMLVTMPTYFPPDPLKTMLIAHCKAPTIPKHQYPPRRTEVGFGHVQTKLTINCVAPDLIGCYSCPPHDDSHMGSQYFVIMTIECGQHFVSDVRHLPNEESLRPGSLFIIDSMVTHWLLHDDYNVPRLPKREYWVGLSWCVQKRRLKSMVSNIVKTFDGKWATRSCAGRYAHLIPS